MNRLNQIEQHCMNAHEAIRRGSSSPAVNDLCMAVMGLCKEIRRLKGEEVTGDGLDDDIAYLKQVAADANEEGDAETARKATGQANLLTSAKSIDDSVQTPEEGL